MKRKTTIVLLSLFALGSLTLAQTKRGEPQKKTTVDEVVWMVGDEPILLSDIEYQKLFARSQGLTISGDPDCVIPEQMAIQKLFLNQAKIDSVQANETQVARMVDMWVQNVISELGSKEKLEEYFNKKLSQIREERTLQARNEAIVEMMKSKISQGVQVTPSEISAFYKQLPKDSLPFIPKTVEVQIIALQPQVPLAELDRVKSTLRGYAEDVNSGKREFSTIARLYSEDKRTASRGGEYGFVGKAYLDPAFATAVFNLMDKTRVSPIIKTDEGYHIAQLIEKRGDLVNFRHILLRPTIEEKAITEATLRIDSEDLPQDIAKVAYELKQGEISKPFVMHTDKGLEQVAIIRIKEIHPEHMANMNNDFRRIKEMALAKKRKQVIDDWIRSRQKQTHIEINERYRDCTFQYPDWIHEDK